MIFEGDEYRPEILDERTPAQVIIEVAASGAIRQEFFAGAARRGKSLPQARLDAVNGHRALTGTHNPTEQAVNRILHVMKLDNELNKITSSNIQD